MVNSRSSSAGAQLAPAAGNRRATRLQTRLSAPDRLSSLSGDALRLVARELSVADAIALEQTCCACRAHLELSWRLRCEQIVQTKLPPPRPLQPLRHAGSAWKRRYAAAYLDSRRKEITRKEITSSDWSFRFVPGDLVDLHLTPDERAAREKVQPRPEFSESGFYSSSLPGAPSAARPLPWSLIVRPPPQQRGQRAPSSANSCVRIGPGAELVRIASYPLLHASRTADWGWRMSNRFVEFFTVGKPTAEDADADADHARTAAEAAVRRWWRPDE